MARTGTDTARWSSGSTSPVSIRHCRMGENDLYCYLWSRFIHIKESCTTFRKVKNSWCFKTKICTSSSTTKATRTRKVF